MDIGILIEDLERLGQRLSEARHQGLPTIAVERENVELMARAAAALRHQRIEVIAECADVLDREFHRVMSLQKPTNDPLSTEAAVNTNIRIAATLLPEAAMRLRAMGEIKTV